MRTVDLWLDREMKEFSKRQIGREIERNTKKERQRKRMRQMKVMEVQQCCLIYLLKLIKVVLVVDRIHSTPS